MKMCKFCGGAQITFDDEIRSESGKLIPLDVTTMSPHVCPKRKGSYQFQAQRDFIEEIRTGANADSARVSRFWRSIRT